MPWELALAGVLLFAGSGLHARAQYVGRVDTTQDNNKPTLRAIAVLEYTGDLAKPNASRLVPIAVWDGESYQPGGLYLAQPVPLTVESGTQYVLQVAGTPRGFFDVKAASDVGGSWIAIGNYQKPIPPHYAKLRRSRNLPRIMGGDDDKPHFAHVPTADTDLGATKAGSAQNSAPPIDPDRPTLQRRTGDTDSQNTSSDNGNTSASNAPAIDPDRPILHEPPKPAPDNSTTASGSESPETATTAIDPNRPRLDYGRPAELESLDVPAEIAKLALHPQEIEEIAAVSDATSRPQHSYVYSWDDPQDKIKLQIALEAIAQNLLARPVPSATAPVTHSHTAHRTTSRKPHKPALPTLTDEQFKAYKLTYGGGATLIFSATTGQGDDTHYITLIAQPDFNGTPIVLFKQITSERELNIVPRMKLIDAVDTNADNRAELIFALENQMGRQYAIYSVANNTVEQVFTTGS
jgi:hypothetical protein